MYTDTCNWDYNWDYIIIGIDHKYRGSSLLEQILSSKYHCASASSTFCLRNLKDDEKAERSLVS